MSEKNLRQAIEALQARNAKLVLALEKLQVFLSDYELDGTEGMEILREALQQSTEKL